MTAGINLATTSAEETRSLGEAVASALRPKDVVSLTGDLGAGKTTLVQGMARALGVEQPVISPTFNLVREYAGRLRLVHMDVYRLERLNEVLELGFDEMIEDDGVVMIEWGDAIEALLPEARLEIELILPPSGDDRSIHLSARGATWAARWEALELSTRQWRSEDA